MNLVRSRKFLDILTSVILAATAGFFAFYGTTKSLWADEAYSVMIAGKSFGEIINALRNDTHPPLYYFLLAIWVEIFGTSEIAVRSLSGIAYLTACFFVYKLGYEIIDDNRFALLCAFLYIISPLATGTAQSARMYALLGFLSTLSTFLFVKIFAKYDKSRLNLCIFVFVNVFGTFTQIWFFFLLAAQMLTFLILIYPKRRVAAFVIYFASLAPFAILWTPILLEQLKINATSWLGRGGINDLITVLLGFYGERIALIFYGSLFATLILSLQLWSREKRESSFSSFKKLFARKETLIFVLILIFSLLIPFALSQFKPIFGQARYAIIALHAVTILIALILSRIASKFSVCAFCALMICVIGTAFIRYQNQPEPCSDKNLSAFVMQNAGNEDILIFTSLSRTTTDYYLQRADESEKYVEKTFPEEINSHSGWRNEKQMLTNESKLETEADILINELLTLEKAKPRKIWVFHGIDNEVSDILKRKLDAKFTLEAKKDATCADEIGKIPEVFYTEILIYR